jgi:DNA polymerase-3 subunit epsilon
MTQRTFVAIDFETANPQRNSACSIGLVRVERGKIVERVHRLIRPPTSEFWFTHIHNISYADVAAEPDFRSVWKSIKPLLRGAKFLAAHNAPFDRSVLRRCCEHYRLVMPKLEFQCTMLLAREKWSIHPTRLPVVCEHLGIQLRHHDALSDAEACAQIVLAAT